MPSERPRFAFDSLPGHVAMSAQILAQSADRGPSPMSTKAERGTKRTCQNPECGSRFYDLNRDPIVCPICEHASTSWPPSADGRGRCRPPRRRPPRKPAKKPVYRAVEGAKPEDAPEAEGDEALAVVEGEEETAAAEDDETFLEEEEEDGADMTGIIGGPVAERTRRA